MDYKVIVCDMDGTLLNSQHKISDYTKLIIGKLVEKGMKIIIATGRPYLDAKYFRDSMGLKSFLVTSNGAVIHNEKDENILSETIDLNISQQILNYGSDKSIFHRNIYTPDKWFADFDLPGLDSFHVESNFTYELADMNNFKIDDINKIFFLGEEDNISNLFKYIHGDFADIISLTLSNENCLEVMKKGVNKGNAIKKISENIGIPLDNFIAFGDALNDYEMLNSVNNSFLMGNAIKQLKEKLPNKEIIDTCDNDGVAKKLSEIFSL